MGGLFGGGSPDLPAPQALPPPPERSDTEIANLAADQRRKFFSGNSTSALTMLSGGNGASGAPGVTTSAATRFLGGTASF